MQRLIMLVRTVALTLAVLFSTSAFADFDAGEAAYKRGDYTAAYKEFKPLAEQGVAEAQTMLGVMYDQGQGVPQDYQEAAKWYREAAVVYSVVGRVFAQGQGVPQDDRIAANLYLKAAELFQKAAAQGDAEAQYNLGVMYGQGKGVPQDYQEAVKWLRKAAEQGVASAQLGLGLMYAQGKGLPQDDQEAVKWYRMAAEQGAALAQLALGSMYDQGKGVPQDYQEAVKWYRKAAEQGDASAQLYLGGKYLLGYGVSESIVVAYALFNLTAASNSSKENKNKAIKARDTAIKNMSQQEIAAAQALTRELLKPGNFSKALDAASKKSRAAK